MKTYFIHPIQERVRKTQSIHSTNNNIFLHPAERALAKGGSFGSTAMPELGNIGRTLNRIMPLPARVGKGELKAFDGYREECKTCVLVKIEVLVEMISHGVCPRIGVLTIAKAWVGTRYISNILCVGRK